MKLVKKLLTAALSAAMLAQTLVVPVMAEVAANKNLITNPGFEDITKRQNNKGEFEDTIKDWWGYRGWIGQGYVEDKSNDNSKGTGINVLAGSGMNGSKAGGWWGKDGAENPVGLITTARVEKNTRYELSFWYKNGAESPTADKKFTMTIVNAANLVNTNETNEGKRLEGANEIVGTKVLWANKDKEWKQAKYVFNSGNYDVIAIDFQDPDKTGNSVLFDDFSLVKSNNLIDNPSFDFYSSYSGREGSAALWYAHPDWMYDGNNNNLYGTGAERIAENNGWVAISGFSANNMETAATLKADTNYKLTWKMKSNTDATENVKLTIASKADSWVQNAFVADKTLLTSDYTAGADWKTYVKYFNSGSYTDVRIDLAATATQKVLYDDFELVEDTDILRNGDFEGGYDCWNPQGGWVIKADSTGAKDGEGYLFFNKDAEWAYAYTTTHQDITVKPSRKYKLTFDEKVTEGDFTVKIQRPNGEKDDKGNDIYVDWQQMPVAKNENWVTRTFDFVTKASDNKIRIVFMANHGLNIEGTITRDTIYIDNVKVEDLGFNLAIENPNFDTDLKGWEVLNQTTSATSVTHETSNNEAYAKLAITEGAADRCASLYQTIAVEKNTNYTVTYKYKNAVKGHNFSVYAGEGTDGTNTPRLAGILQNHTKATDWTEASYSFNSGDYDKVTLEVVTCNPQNAEVYVDDFAIAKADVDEGITVNNAAYLVNDGRHNVTAAVANNTNDKVKANIYAALYDGNDNLIGVGVNNNVEIANGGIYNFSTNIDVPTNTTVKKKSIFVWQSGDLKPLAQRVDITE